MIIKDEKILRRLQSLFSVVAKANEFVHLEDNMYKDRYGRKYYLDTLGFHTMNQWSNLELLGKAAGLEEEMKRYKRLSDRELLGAKSRTKILSILQNGNLVAESKCNGIKNYLSGAGSVELTE